MEYTIQPGDTLVRIAVRFGVTVKQIVESNGLSDGNRISSGHMLRIPLADASTAPGNSPATSLSALPSTSLKIDRTTFTLETSDYVEERVSKNLLILHYTAGSTSSGTVSQFRTGRAKDPATGLLRDDRIATAYVLDPNGTIYELFDPRCWAHHLKAGTVNERRSVGIEIVCPGALREDANDASFLNWWPPADPVSRNALFRTRYCAKHETGRFVELSWRGFRYWAAYTDAQLKQLPGLVQYLCDALHIPKHVPPRSKWTPDKGERSYFDTYEGVAGHHHFRDDKFDPGPALDWALLGLAEAKL